MKKLIAKKPCSFNGKKFFIGNEIPAEYVLNPIAQSKMGVLELVEVESTDDGAAPEEGGPLLPPSSTLEEDETTAMEEIIYSKNKLSRMTKPEVCAIAEQIGVKVNDELTKEKIVELIMESQGE